MKKENIFLHNNKKETGNVIIDKFGGSHNLYYKHLNAKKILTKKKKEEQGFVVKNIWELMFGENERYKY
tara:strand:+ start:1269 stop:1475 length:207 start_codon:yes stop_codon:yes gene_type:complete